MDHDGWSREAEDTKRGIVFNLNSAPSTQSLKNIQDIKYSCWFPLQEHAIVVGKQMLRSPSLNGATTQPPRSSFSPSPPSKICPPVSPTRPPSLPIPPPRTCSSMVSMEDIRTEEN